MDALVRHYKAAGFSDKVSRLAAAPRQPSTNRMYNDRWLRFTRWAAGQGFDRLSPTAAQIASFLYYLFDTHGLSPQTIKGYKTCLGSVLNRAGKAKVVLHKTIFDMITWSYRDLGLHLLFHNGTWALCYRPVRALHYYHRY